MGMAEFDAVAIGSRMSAERKARKLSQQEIANRLGIHRTTYGEYERGEELPSLKRLNEIAAAIGVAAEKLLAAPEGAPPRELPPIAADLDQARRLARSLQESLEAYAEIMCEQQKARGK